MLLVVVVVAAAPAPAPDRLESMNPPLGVDSLVQDLSRLGVAEGDVVMVHASLKAIGPVAGCAEYVAAVPQRRRVRRYRLIKTHDGPQVRVVECLDDEFGIADHPGEDYFATVLRCYLAAGRASTARVGRAGGELIDAADLVDYAVRWMDARLVGANPG